MPAVGHPLSSLSWDKSGAEPSEKKHAREQARTRTMKPSREENRKEKTLKINATMRRGDYCPIGILSLLLFSFSSVACRLACLRAGRVGIAENQDCAGI